MKIASFFKNVDEGGVYASRNARGYVAYIASFRGKTYGFQNLGELSPAWRGTASNSQA